MNFAPEILTTTGVAPGRVLPGEDHLVLYGQALRGARVELEGPAVDTDDPDAPGCADRQRGCPRVTLPGIGDERGTSLRFKVPSSAEPGLYRVARSGQTVRERFVPRGATSGGLWDYEVYYFIAFCRLRGIGWG